MKVGIVGLGYVGLPLAVAFAEAGHDVVGVDASPAKVERLRRSESDVEDVTSERLRALAARFTVDDDYRKLAACEAVLVCVPTPLTEHREPDLSHLIAAAAGLGRVLHEGRLVVIESTTYPAPRASGSPRSSRNRGSPPAATSTSPTRRSGSIRAGATDTMRTTPKVVGGPHRRVP